MADMPRIGFIGLGYMGHGMAVNILARGFPLAVMAHRKREAVEDLVGRGAREVATPAEMAATSDIIILCVTGAALVDSLVRGKNGLSSAWRQGLVVIDCTTSDPATIVQLARDFGGKGTTFVDAPLGRSPREAWSGTLSTMVGCDLPTLERIRPVLSAFANTIQHAGRLGDGHRLKLVNNLVSLGFAALYSEALIMARKAGMSTETFDQLIRSSRMHCAFYDTFMSWSLTGDADAHRFSLETALHTITDVAEFARSLDLKNTLAASIRDVYSVAVAAGNGQAMLPELPRFVASANGIDLAPVRAGDSQ